MGAHCIGTPLTRVLAAQVANFYILDFKAWKSTFVALTFQQIFYTTTKSTHTPSKMALRMQANVLTMVVEPLSFVRGLEVTFAMHHGISYGHGCE